MDGAASNRGDSPEATFLQGVGRLARRDQDAGSTFHQTRAPFTRLRDGLGRMRSDRPPSHPSSCQDPTCHNPLAGHYYRRADGFTLCGACFDRWQAGGRAREAEAGGESPEPEG